MAHLKNIRVGWLRYSEMMHFGWFKIVKCLGTANQSALFQRSIAMLL